MLKFTVFADAHYKKVMYPAKISDIEAVLARAKVSGSELVIHCGDLCNDYIGSPELTRALLLNPDGIKVAGVFGNHELEGENNSMEIVIPTLTNIADAVFPESDEPVGYYHIDKGEFRLIFTDANYSKNPTTGAWEHNKTNSYGAPAGNTDINALAPTQLKWLESLLDDAAKRGLHCIVISHASLHEDFYLPSADAKTVREIFAKVNSRRSGTVLMQVSGHAHEDRAEIHDGVVYFSVNTLINGCWKPTESDHYADASLTHERGIYDADGNLIKTEIIPIKWLWQSRNTHYFESALSALVTVDEKSGVIEIDGSTTDWRFGIVPEQWMLTEYAANKIESRRFELK